MYKYQKKTYTLAGFEPGLFCSGGGRDDNYASPPGFNDIFYVVSQPHFVRKIAHVFVANAFISPFDTQTMHIKSSVTNVHTNRHICTYIYVHTRNASVVVKDWLWIFKCVEDENQRIQYVRI
jgi:hypothetical protein